MEREGASAMGAADSPLRTTAILSALWALILVELYLSKASRDAFFTAAWGSRWVPILNVIVLFGSMALARVQGVIWHRAGPRLSLPLACAGMGVTYLASAFQLGLHAGAAESFAPADRTVILALILARTFYGVFAVTLFWSLVDSSFRADPARRLSPWIALGGPVGALAGASIASAVTSLSPSAVLALAGVLLLGVAPVAYAASADAAVRHVDPAGFLARMGRSAADLRPVDARVMLAFRYTRLLFMLVATIACTSTLLKWGFVKLAEESGGNVSALASYFAVVNLKISVVSLVCQIMVAPVCLRVIGPARSLLLLPAFLLCTAGLAAFERGAGLLSGLTTIYLGLEYTVSQLAREMMFVPTPAEVRFKAKTWVDTVGSNGGALFASALIAALTGLGADSPTVILGIVVTLALAWTATARTLGREYEAATGVFVARAAAGRTGGASR